MVGRGEQRSQSAQLHSLQVVTGPGPFTSSTCRHRVFAIVVTNDQRSRSRMSGEEEEREQMRTLKTRRCVKNPREGGHASGMARAGRDLCQLRKRPTCDDAETLHIYALLQ